jgi:hypothetical protein
MKKCDCCGQRLPEHDESLPDTFYIVIRRMRIGKKNKTKGELRKYKAMTVIFTDVWEAKRPYQGMVFEVKKENYMGEGIA